MARCVGFSFFVAEKEINVYCFNVTITSRRPSFSSSSDSRRDILSLSDNKFILFNVVFLYKQYKYQAIYQ
jgi:hypothetical protein